MKNFFRSFSAAAVLLPAVLSGAPVSTEPGNMLADSKPVPMPGVEITADEIICDNTEGARRSGCTFSCDVPEKTADAIYIEAWSKCENYSFRKHSFYSLKIFFLNDKYKTVSYFRVPFNTGTHDYEKASMVVFPSEPVKHYQIITNFQGKGAVMFKDVFMRKATASEVKDAEKHLKEYLP